MKTPIAIAVSAVTLGLFALLGWLEVEHVDINQFVLLVPVLLPGIAAMFGVTALKAQTSTIQTNTNGTLSKLLASEAQKNSQLMAALSYLTPEQATGVLALTANVAPLLPASSAKITPAPVNLPAAFPTVPVAAPALPDTVAPDSPAPAASDTAAAVPAAALLP